MNCLNKINGNSAVTAYLTDIFLAADTGLSEGLQATLVCLIQVVGIFAMMTIVDRYGRRILVQYCQFQLYQISFCHGVHLPDLMNLPVCNVLFS